METFVVARNPEEGSALPYVLWVPVDGGIALKARDPWPTSARVYCHPFDGDMTDLREVVEQVPVRHCARRGSAIDLVLDRSRNNRAQFVFTTVRGRPAIFWQTAKVVRSARPGVRVPGRRASGLDELEVLVDSRERYPYKFAGRKVRTRREALASGDYAVRANGEVAAAVERKTLGNLVATISDGSLGYQMAELSALPASAVVVEDRYSSLLKLEHVQPGWILDVVASLQVRYPDVPIVFCENRKLAEEWTYRFLGAAAAEARWSGDRA